MLARLSRSRSRAGVTLVELLVVMVLASVVASAIVVVILKQGRFYRSTNELIDTRAQLRQMVVVLPADLRGMSTVGGDIVFMSDSAIEFRSTFGTSSACLETPKQLGIPPTRIAKGTVLTSWMRAPVVGDSIAVYDDSTTTMAKDDRWVIRNISAVATSTDPNKVCPLATGMIQVGDLTVSNPGYLVNVTPDLPANVRAGAAVRFFRRVRYSLYKDAVDGLWYLGYRDCVNGRVPVCSVMISAGGPFQPYAASAAKTSGLEFAYYDSLGAVTADPKLVARVSMILRATGSTPIQLTGNVQTTFKDSLRIEVAIRNRK
jgi:prepilin-type N-terminal cleavage/methylation domain-containing protein